MKTSKEWWDSVKKNNQLLIQWLTNQYHGEVKASQKIEELILSKNPPKDSWKRVIQTIIEQERNHASWIAGLLENRGIKAKVLNKKERYWDKTLSQITDWDTGCAVAAHAEAMRLERIRIICEDPETPDDIRVVFENILVEEEFHASTFKRFTTDLALESARDNHLAGMKELGLEI